MIVQDINRSDVNGKTPKMASIAEILKEELVKLDGLPFCSVSTDDNLCSSITTRGSLDAPEQWRNGIFENGKSFTILIMPEKRKRYYEDGDKVVATSRMNRLSKFRKYTASPEKVIKRIYDWIELQEEQ